MVKPVICVETGRRFNSVKAAAEFALINPKTISAVLNGRCPTAGGYHWEYAEPEEYSGPMTRETRPLRKPTRTIYAMLEEARRRSEKTGRFVSYGDIQKEETLQLIKEGKLCPTKKRK